MYAPRGAVCVGGAENGVPPNTVHSLDHIVSSLRICSRYTFILVPFLGMHVCMHAAPKGSEGNAR